MSRLIFHECLGRGGFGEVYRATWERDDQNLEVAVKLLNAAITEGSDAAARLRDEARLLMPLSHPGILKVYDLVVLEHRLAMIAEYVPGEDLDRCILAGLPAAGLLEVISRVASALAAAWGDISPHTGKPLRLVHRDIKPENIRLTPDGDPKLLDFGLARAIQQHRHAKTNTNTVVGSYRYMSPERFDMDIALHPSMDVFALGCILYEGLAFKRLFADLTMRQMMLLSLPGTARYDRFVEDRLVELPDDVLPEIKNLIRRLVAREPKDRPLPGRVAAICEDLAEQVRGATLKGWAGGRAWVPGKLGEGDWSGRAVEIPRKVIGMMPLDGTDDLTLTWTGGADHLTEDTDLNRLAARVTGNGKMWPSGFSADDDDDEAPTVKLKTSELHPDAPTVDKVAGPLKRPPTPPPRPPTPPPRPPTPRPEASSEAKPRHVPEPSTQPEQGARSRTMPIALDPIEDEPTVKRHKTDVIPLDLDEDPTGTLILDDDADPTLLLDGDITQPAITEDGMLPLDGDDTEITHHSEPPTEQTEVTLSEDPPAGPEAYRDQQRKVQGGRGPRSMNRVVMANLLVLAALLVMSLIAILVVVLFT